MTIIMARNTVSFKRRDLSSAHSTHRVKSLEICGRSFGFGCKRLRLQQWKTFPAEVCRTVERSNQAKASGLRLALEARGS